MFRQWSESRGRAKIPGSYSGPEHAVVAFTTIKYQGVPASYKKGKRSAMIAFSERAVVSANVLIRFLDQESVLLNLETERYFGLDAVGTRMWQVVTEASTVEAALARLVEEYDAPLDTLRTDLTNLLQHLVDNGLIAMQPADVGTASPV